MFKTLKTLEDEVTRDNELSEESLTKFKETASVLSSFLPQLSDSSLVEIDDLLYPNEDNKPVCNPPSIIKTDCEEWTFIPIFFTIYKHAIKSMDRKFDTTCLQIFDNLSSIPAKFEDVFQEKIETCIVDLVRSRHYIKICIALKFLKVAMEKHRKDFEMFLNKIGNTFLYSILFLSKLKNIPQARHPDKMRITSWITKQASLIFDNLDIMSFQLQNVTPKTFKYLKTYYGKVMNSFDDLYIHFLMDSLRSDYKTCFSFHIEHLHNYFMSARTKDEKVLLLEIFIKDSWFPHDYIRGFHEYSGLFVYVCEYVLSSFFSNVEYLLKNFHYSNDLLNEIDKYHDYEFPQYLSDINPAVNSVINESGVEKMGENCATIVQHKQSNGPDFTIELFLFHDDFMKSLQVINIMCTGCLMGKNLYKFKGKDFSGGLYTNIFRRNNTPIKYYINAALIDPARRGEIQWWFRKTMEKCPFLIFSKSQFYLMDDLIRMLKGEEDEVLEERLYVAVNTLITRDAFSINNVMFFAKHDNNT